MAFPRWLKQNSISVLFLIAVLILASTIILSSERSTGLCGGDPNFTACARNWVNAGENLATVLVAALALIIAWGQLKANAAMAELPVLNQRIITAKAAAIVVVNFSSHLEFVADMLEDVVGRIGQSGGDLSLTTASETIVKEWDAIFSDHTPVRRIADDVLDIDLEEHLTSIIENHTLLHNEVWSVVSLFRQFLEAQDAEDSLSDRLYLQTKAEIAKSRIVKAERHIRAAAAICRKTLQEMSNVAVALNAIIENAKVEREKLRLR